MFRYASPLRQNITNALNATNFKLNPQSTPTHSAALIHRKLTNAPPTKKLTCARQSLFHQTKKNLFSSTSNQKITSSKHCIHSLLYFEFCHPSKILHRNANIKLNKPPGINFRNENVMSVQLNKLKKIVQH